MNNPLEFTYSTPALLFPAVSLLFLAFTNRFIAYADLIRSLHSKWKADGNPLMIKQIGNLRLRMAFIRWMQILGAVSLCAATACMFFLFVSSVLLAEVLFSFALVAMLASLILLVIEISISMKALDLQINDIAENRS